VTAKTPPGKSGCAFCDVLYFGAPAQTVREWDDAIAIVPLHPVVPGHLLVLSRLHVPHALADAAVTAATVRRAVELARTEGTAALNLITSIGAAATQTVHHLHIHIVPRTAGDGLALPWDPPAPEERR
jgi:histidine triad (HIT) family protein